MSDRLSVDRDLAAVLRRHLRGNIIAPEDAGFDSARRLWNAAIDRRPAAIAMCADAEDVVLGLQMAGDLGVGVTVRAGAHNVAGRSVMNGALLLDLSRLREVVVHPSLATVSVQGGALWRDVDAATATHGLATTGGFVSSTGVGGLTLGGGVGWLMRRHGLAVDNMLGARVVLADGRNVWASAKEHEDLFWGLRGGAGNLGVVTSFEFALHPVRQVLAGLVVYPGEAASDVLKTWRDFARQAPPDFCSVALLITAPPLPFLEFGWHGKPVLVLALCWCGDESTGESVLAPLRHLPGRLADITQSMPYAAWQTMQDAAAPPHRHQYWKTANFTVLDDATLDLIAQNARNPLGPECEIHVQHLGGAVAKVAARETAFAHRHAQYFINLLGVTSDAQDFERIRSGVRDIHHQLVAAALPGQMPNFCGDADQDSKREFGLHAARLETLRGRYDPFQLFRRQ